MTEALQQDPPAVLRLEILGDNQYESGLEPSYHNTLVEHYAGIVKHLPDLLASAATVQVANEQDVEGMAQAHEMRLAVKRARGDLERGRKELKKLPLTIGRAIDGMASAICEKISPVERELQDKEDFVRLAEERRMAVLAEERWGKLEAVSFECAFDLGTMSQEQFDDLLDVATLAYEAKAAKAKTEVAAAAQAELEWIKAEQERAAWQEVEDKRLDDERVEFARIDAENAELRRQADGLRQAEAAQLAREQQAERDRLAAPDADKLGRLVDDIDELDWPSVSGEVACAAWEAAKEGLNAVVDKLRIAIAKLDNSQGGAA